MWLWRWWTLPLVVVGLLTSSQLVFANSGAPLMLGPDFFWMTDDFAVVLWLALPASVLASFLERPFVQRAGVKKNALWYSLQANLFSLVLGYMILPFALKGLAGLGPLWYAFAVFVSIVSERTYLRWRAAEVRPLEGGWIILGNIFSSIVLLALPGATFVLRERWWTWKSDLMAYYDGLFWATIAGSIVILLTSFLIPVIFCTRSDSSIDGSAIGSTPCGVSETDVGLHLKRD